MPKLWFVLGIIALALGFIGSLHQKICFGTWFTWEQFCHHEPLIGIAVCVGIALLFVAAVEKYRPER